MTQPDHDVVAPDTRSRIRALLAESPGLHLREISRLLACPMGTTLHHLDRLDREAAIVTRRDGRYKRFFLTNSVDRRDRDVVGLLRRTTPRRIVETLAASGPMTQRELCERIGLTRSTVSPHLARLTAEGVLVRHPSFPENTWDVAEARATQRLLGILAPAAVAEA